MNLKQAKIILEKINRLYQTMTLDNKIDVFEQDLMLSYIRQLHEAFAPEEPIAKVRRRAPKVELPTTPKVPKIAKTPPVKAPAPEPKATPAPKKIQKETPAVSVEPTPPPPPKVKVERPAPSTPKLSKENEALFDYKEASDLSEKLSESPIKDLSKAMGLNEKIFTVQELFNGEQLVYDEVIKTLNGLKSYDEAKRFLASNIAGKYNWISKEKKKKAKNFIKLVRRRYKK